MADSRLVEPDLELIREIRKAGGGELNRCYQCATCSVVCNLSPDDSPFPRKEMILAQWGQTERLVSDPDIWLCYQCNDCSIHCPRGARPSDVLAAVRSFTYRFFSFPSFMGKALANPKFLPILFLVPALILVACIYISAPRTGDGDFLFMHTSMNDPAVTEYVSELHGVVKPPDTAADMSESASYIDFNIFLPHSTVDVLFVFGNIVIFSFAAIGFSRFRRSLLAAGRKPEMSFVSSLAATLKEIISHSRFFKCDANRPRSWAHIMLLSGFVGAMVTTGATFVFIFIPHYLELLGIEQIQPFFLLPFAFFHPVKILGAVSGILLCVGGGIIIYRRWTDRDNVGANGYADNLFVWIITLTGLTGMMAWLIRAGGIANLAYASYYVHILLVFFLLWYMPYSKFAHMIYRTLALAYATSIGREAES
jgi:quinone-modifying oxidoreductase subunit QmoC